MKNTMPFKSVTRLLRTAALAAMLGLSAAAWAEDVKFTILLVSDIYEIDAPKTGGFARLAQVARDERKNNKHVLYVHAGDTISPSLLSNLDKGAHVIEMLNLEPPDIFVPGNHEYDFGPAVFRDRMSEFGPKTELLAANLREPTGAVVDGFADNAFFTYGGLKVGVLGLTASNSIDKSSPGNLRITHELELAADLTDKLRELGADIVIGVAHSSRSLDHELREKGGFDILLTGDDHDLFLAYDGDTVLAEPREEGEHLVAIDVHASISERDGRRRVRWNPSFRIIDTSEVKPAADAQAKVDKLVAKLDAELEVAIGTTAVELDTRRPTVRGKEAAFANLIADAMRAAVNADVAITNGGGIRGDKIYAPGTTLTRKDVLKELPFGNTTMMLEVTGATILAALENGFSKVEDGAGRFPHVSGMTVVYNLSRKPGSRVRSVTIGSSKLDPSATYTLATNNYMAGGGDGYRMFGDGKILLGELDADLMANQVINHIESSGSVSPRVEERMKAQ